MGTYIKYAISQTILRIIESNKNYYTLKTFLYRFMLISLIVKILPEGTFSRVVAQMIKERIATCEFILLSVIEFKYIRHGVFLRSIILYLKYVRYVTTS